MLVALIPTPSGVTASLPALPSVPQGTEGRECLWAPRLFWRATVRRRTDGRGVPLAAKGQHQPIMSFFTPTTEIFAGKWDFAKMERRRSM